MLRKLLLTGALIGAVIAFVPPVRGAVREVAHFVAVTMGGWFGDVEQAARDAVPIETSVKEARDMLSQTVPVIYQHRRTIAQREVELERLRQRVAEFEQKLAKDKQDILTLRDDLQKGQQYVRYGTRNYSADEIKQDLARRLERYKTNESTLASLKQVLEARQAALNAARQKLDNMLAVRQQLEVEIENQEARLEMVRAAQAVGEYNLDDSQLSRLKQLVSDIEMRVQVAAKLADEEADAYIQIPVGEPVPEDIVDQVTRYFDSGNQQPVNAANDRLIR
jgi:DNA repair exonuclease SbcCD ATPase subunit